MKSDCVVQIARSGNHADMAASPDTLTTPRTNTPTDQPQPLRHSRADDVAGILVGTFIASLGLFLLRSAGAVTGGTAGIGLLVSYAAAVPFGVVFLAVNLPFLALALWKKGASFTLRTLVSVVLVSVFASLQPLALGSVQINPVYGVVVGNLLAGVGMLILFRHRSSLGGISILALILQDRLGWRAGYVQMAVDVAIIAISLTVVPPLTVALSALGAVVINCVIAMNHRPGRYVGA